MFRHVSGRRFFPQRQFLLRNVSFFVMSVVLGDWLSIYFRIVPSNLASLFDGISPVSRIFNRYSCGMYSESSAISGKVN